MSAGSLLSKLQGDFFVHDLDEAGDPAYYGFLNLSGAWYIIEATSETQFRFATRESVSTEYRDYSDAWTARASLDYDYIDQVNI